MAIKTGSPDSGEVDIFAGPSDGSAGLYRFSLAAKPPLDGGLRLEIEVPAQLARPARDLVEALRAGRRCSRWSRWRLPVAARVASVDGAMAHEEALAGPARSL